MQTRDVPIGYLALPPAASSPGVVLVHDVWGLREHQKDLSRRLAGEGFATLAIDLYHDRRNVEIADAGTWMRGLSDPDILDRLSGGRALLGSLDQVQDRKIAVVGFCMGGMYALLAGCEPRGFSAVVSFYGILSHTHGLLFDPAGLDAKKKPIEPLAAVQNLSCPLLAMFGDRDDFIPMSDIDELKRRLAGASVPATIRVYEGAGHAFMNDTRPAAYRKEQAADAWERMLVFLRSHLAQRC